MMTPQQKTAIAHPCRLAVEVTHPRFLWKRGGMTVRLTTNTGYE